jgi:hypothetical protein
MFAHLPTVQYGTAEVQLWYAQSDELVALTPGAEFLRRRQCSSGLWLHYSAVVHKYSCDVTVQCCGAQVQL